MNTDKDTLHNKIQTLSNEEFWAKLKEFAESYPEKQNKLTAGNNITIENDVISAAGSSSGGGGIDDIKAEATEPLHLDATISGTLATITGSVDEISKNNFYGIAGCSTYIKDWQETGWKLSEANTIDDSWTDSVSDANGTKNDLFYQVYQTYAGNSDGSDGGIYNDFNGDNNGLLVALPYPHPSNIKDASSLDEVDYVIGITPNGTLRRIPISLFTQE